jgi:hypothetical protein
MQIVPVAATVAVSARIFVPLTDVQIDNSIHGFKKRFGIRRSARTSRAGSGMTRRLGVPGNRPPVATPKGLIYVSLDGCESELERAIPSLSVDSLGS